MDCDDVCVNINPKELQSLKNKDTLTIDHGMKRRLRVQMQTLHISEESTKYLFETIQTIQGANFRLAEASEFDNKNANLGKQFWQEQNTLVIKGVVDYSSQDTISKINSQKKDFATLKLITYNFHSSHCAEALKYTHGDVGMALEILFVKYYKISFLPKIEDDELEDLLLRRQEEKEALEGIYENMFQESIKNKLWTVHLNLNYLIETKTEKEKKSKNLEKLPLKNICRFFLNGKCRFATKCKFSHELPKSEEAPRTQAADFVLEIRFPDDNKYPFEPPYFYFYKVDGQFPALDCLRICRKLYDEASKLCGEPSIFSIISLFENEEEIKLYLKENKEHFLDSMSSLYPKFTIEQDNTPSHYKTSKSIKRNNKVITEDTIKTDFDIRSTFLNKQNGLQYLKMKQVRKKLPAWTMMSNILNVIHENSIVIISGETGCGKSTQVPQFILDDWLINLNSDERDHVEIICTQPRRISAIGVAERVAAERDEKVGNTIGYQIHLENKVSQKTRLTFCTTGILLQRLISDPLLNNITHVIVDEVHERSSDSDNLLMELKSLLSKRPDFKVILMSATVNAEIFSQYFGNVPIFDIPGRTFPVTQLFLEDILDPIEFDYGPYVKEYEGGREQLDSDFYEAVVKKDSIPVPKNSLADEDLNLSQIVVRYSKYSASTQKSLYFMKYYQSKYDELIESVLAWLVGESNSYPKTGSILVFLPGIAEIMDVQRVLNSNPVFSKDSFLIIPLHSTLSNEEQSLVFKKPKPGVRKIILSTNIAETSVTIDDCVYVIDTGKMKETRFDVNQNLESLDLCWVSRANALQRKGRAGRVMPGVCIHLYTSFRFKHRFLAQPIPEILRIALEPLILRIKLRYKDQNINVYKIFDELIESPSTENISTAIKRLQDIGALDPESKLTPLGHHLAALPVDVRIGKLILFGAIFCCLDSALTVAACLSHKSPFISSAYKSSAVLDKKKKYLTANSDQITTLRVYRKWLDIYTKHGFNAARVFAEENLLSLQTLQALADTKHHFLELLISIDFVPVNISRIKRFRGQDCVIQVTGDDFNSNNENYKLLSGLLCAALYPNVVQIMSPPKSYCQNYNGTIEKETKPEELRFKTIGDKLVNIHSSSVVRTVGSFSCPFLVYQNKIKTSKVFIRDVTMVHTLSLVLFSGYGIDIKLHNGKFFLSLADEWIMFNIDCLKAAQLLQLARVELVKLLEKKMGDPSLNMLAYPNGKRLINTIVDVISKN